MDESLDAMQAEFAEAEFKHRRDCLGTNTLPLARWIDDTANGRALTPDVHSCIASASSGRARKGRLHAA